MASHTFAQPILRSLGAPQAFIQRGVEKMKADIVLPQNATFPTSAFARGMKEKGKHDLPQTIAHRGYRAKYPENTMAAFKGAVDIGAHALETDIHLTRDDVVVLSHDATLARCFGKDEKIIDQDWSYISSLKTIAKPPQTMPRLIDILEYVAEPEQEDIWVLLDIKLDNESDKVMRLIADTLKSVQASPGRPWNSRVVLGIWAAKYLPLAHKYMPDYSVSHIGFNFTYARQFFKTPHVSFNMLIPMLQAPGGTKFIRECQEKERPIYAWTVNDESKMDWCIRKKLDGVITDDPKLFLDVCEHFDPAKPKRMSMRVLLDTIRLWLFALIFGRMYINKLDRRDQKPQPIDMK